MSESPVSSTMTFWEHLEELRGRLIKSIAAIAVGVAIAWIYRQPLLAWLTRPFVLAWQSDQLGSKATLHFGSPAALFIAYVKLAFIGGCVFALPVVLYQLWAFIAPGLYSKEKRSRVSVCRLFLRTFCCWGLVWLARRVSSRISLLARFQRTSRQQRPQRNSDRND